MFRSLPRRRSRVPVVAALLLAAAVPAIAAAPAPAPTPAAMTEEYVPQEPNRPALRVASSPEAARLAGVSAILRAATPAGSASDYTFSIPNIGGQPAHWGTCTIRWTLDPTNVSKGGTSFTFEKARIAKILAGVTQLSGYQFTWVNPPAGVGKVLNRNEFLFPVGPGSPNPQIDLVYAFGSGRSSEAYSLPGLNDKHVIGMGGFNGALAVPDSATGLGKVYSGAMMIDYEEWVKKSITDKIRVQTLQHETGHALGLGHAEAGNQVMSAIIYGVPWGAGDVAGLRKLRELSGC